MTEFYTHVLLNRGSILRRGYKDGKRVQTKEYLKPYLFIETNDKNSKYKTIKNKPVEKIDFESTTAAREFIKNYENVDNFNIYGMTSWIYPWIYDEYYSKGEIEYDQKLIKIAYIDLEWKMADENGKKGFPDVRIADREITAVTIRHNKHSYMFGYKDFKYDREKITYFKCDDERMLLKYVINTLKEIDPDVVSGWNSDGADIPYLTSRCERILGETKTKELSPWGIITKKEVFIKGKESYQVTWEGIACLDYMQVYKKFKSANQEMYKLEYIANLELNSGKIDYSEYEDLDDLYDKNPQLYHEYNEHDTILLERMEEKLHLLDIQFAIAYMDGCNYVDAFATVKPCDSLIHKKLLRKNIVVIQSKFGSENEFAGAFVKEPIPGKYKWVVSFDYKSLYPSLTRQCNISPETIITTIPNINVDMLFDKKLGSKLHQKLIDENVSLCATGCIFDNSKEGFIPEIMREIYEDRVTIQKELKSKKKLLTKYEAEGKETSKLKDNISALDSRQYALKIFLNSIYGAMGNPAFRWFDIRLAESITKTGQLAIKWTERGLNAYLNEICETDINWVKAGDTDSAYIELDPWVQKFVKESDTQKICDAVDEFCKTKLKVELDRINKELLDYLNHRTPVLEMNRENIADVGFWTAKKRYALNVLDTEGNRHNSPKLKITGLESIKNSTPRACRKYINDAILILLREDEATLHKYIEETEKDYRTKSFTEISKTISVNNLVKYSNESTIYINKGTPAHVKATLIYNHLLRKQKLTDKYKVILEGDKVKFCYLTMPNIIGVPAICAPEELPPELDIQKYIDYNLMFEKTFIEPIKAMTSAIGWNIEEKSSLEDLFI